MISFSSSIALGGEWSGTISGKMSYETTTSRLDWGVSVDTSYSLDLGEGYYLRGALLLKYQDENKIRPVRLQELYLQGSAVPWKDVDFRLGLLEITWGASDVASPVDLLNPRPFSLSMDSESFQEKIPVPALDLEWYFSNNWSLEIFWQPSFVSHFLPQVVKENMILSPLATAIGFDEEKTAFTLEETAPLVNFLSPIWALRLRGGIGNFDLALSFQEGYYLSSFPYRSEVTLLSDGSTSVQVFAGYPRRSIVGLELQGTISGLEGVTVRGDLAFVFPEKWTNQVLVNGSTVSETPIFAEPYLKASLGIDYTHNNFYANLNYLLGNPWEEGDNISPYLYFVTHWTSDDEKWKPFLNSVLSLHDGSMVNIVGVEYKPKSGWSTTLSYSLSSGAPGSTLGNIADTLFLEVKYSF